MGDDNREIPRSGPWQARELDIRGLTEAEGYP